MQWPFYGGDLDRHAVYPAARFRPPKIAALVAMLME
jgi:hypothetical protein